MYTGIVSGTVEIEQVDTEPGLMRLGVRLPGELLRGLQRGASIAIDGVCLTALEQDGNIVFFQAMSETLQRTTLGDARPGRRVNVERSATQGVEVGGHIVSGHVDGAAEIVAIDNPANNHVVTFRPPPHLMKYIFLKGFIAIDGASLTVAEVDHKSETFKVWFIPETLRLTTFGFKRVGDRVNLEVEAQTRVLVDTVERLLPSIVERLLPSIVEGHHDL